MRRNGPAQLFANQMDDLAAYQRLPELMRGYIEELHRVCPASKAYTYHLRAIGIRAGIILD